ncbi:hypothetical protein DPMN_053124 [Dreissena polymorpha]|uniref:Uncharacterized protein n=1 Tax=Dreissena polymorpha TaxID=45954 RepID=A0A9D4HQF5_DREPO|nr:hypothetical protein DPMN_053124 [Dreissena polymorpha]
MSANEEETRFLYLSTVLKDIGVSKGVILLRRNPHLTEELLFTAQVRLDGYDNDLFIFGSQSEGTATI